ncbi:bromodomain-containing protein [Amanita rubescens]|nr:bromodomain-containing protein [Amanita rubescens]
MVRGARTSPSVTLPKVSFQKTDEDYSLRLFGVHNLQARSYGFNDFSQFQRPKHYIQYIEPIENDLARQVEYDMDEQDQEWLDSVNAERKKEQIDMVSCETFEIIMDRLEKEWFDLTKNIPKTDFAMPSEDSTCAVCDDSEGENSNAIVFCDGCNLAVHQEQDCYGVPYIPEGQWLCRKCTVSPENPVSCVLCPIEGGAFKQTVTGGWVHLLCAIWVPETRVANEVFMEPITGVDKISKQRWRLKCSLCDIKGGACIQCAKASCFTAFHTTCARKEKLLMPMKSTQGSEPVTLTCYCEKHLPKEQQDAREVALERERIAEESSAALSKSARAYAKTYKPGPPVVPALIINRILNYIAKVQLRKRQEFVQMVARYWSLKREARRGAPLLKRLHLEPWTANGGNGQSDEDKEMKLQLLLRLREDLENVHEMTTLTRKRESRKQAQATVIRDTLLSILAPFEHLLRDSFNRIITVDRNEYFRHPVSKTEVPDYFDVVKKPMYWSMIEEKINNHSYFGSQEFKDDITLVIDNAILYNQLNTAYHKTAVRIRSAMQPIFEELDHRLATAKADVAQPTNDTDENGNVAQHANDTNENGNVAAMAIDTSIGDLEPPFEFLKLLTSIEAIQEETELLLDKNPLDSLFSFELAHLKPPPPLPSLKLSKPKRDRKADLERKRKEREAEAAARALISGTRPRRKVITVVAAAAAIAVAADEEGEADAEAEAEGEEELPDMEMRRGSSLPSPSDAPPLVTDVDHKGSFKMFDKGWILPPEQKRGGRRPVERQPLPPRKRVKTGKRDYTASRLSVVSTSASDNQTLLQISPVVDTTVPPAPSEPSVPQERPVPIFEAMDVDTSALRTTISEDRTAPPTPREPSEPKRVVHGPDGQIIVEVLDSPLIRKQMTKLKKAERKRLMEQQQSGESIVPVAAAVAGPSRLAPGPDSVEAESELSSLSDLGSEAVEPKDREVYTPVVSSGRGRRRGPPRRMSVAIPGVSGDFGSIQKGQTLEETYPWWPAVVYEYDDPRIPLVVKMEGEGHIKRGSAIYMVQFFDRTRSWWVDFVKSHYASRGKLRLDDDLLKKQRWKSPANKAECKLAYEWVFFFVFFCYF